jgi:hypothetical protein
VDPNQSADRVFIVASVVGLVSFGACIYAFLEGNRVHELKTPVAPEKGEAPAESADDSSDEDE